MKQIITLDILRGYFLLVIFVDHLFRFPSIFELFTGQGKLWVSAAEGFFIISGILVGYIYGSKFDWKKLWKRAGKLYLLSVCLTILFTIWGGFLPTDNIMRGLETENFIVRAFSFNYTYGWADFLHFYAVFMLFAPFALTISKKFGSKLLLVISLLIWFWGRNISSYFAWQLIFISALVAGKNLTSIELYLKKFIFIFYSIFVISLTLSVYFAFINKMSFGIFDKDSLGIGRFILAWIWFWVAYLFVRSREEKLAQSVFCMLGQNSLLVYIVSAVILFPINAWVPRQFGYWGNTLFTVVGCLIIYLLVRTINLTNTTKRNTIGD